MKKMFRYLSSGLFLSVVAFAITALATTACSGLSEKKPSRLASVGQPVGQYRGVASLNKTLQEVVLDSSERGSSEFNIVHYAAGDQTFSTVSSLSPLLGAWSASGPFASSDSLYRNGVPTAVSVFLYEGMMGNLASALASACTASAFPAAVGGPVSPPQLGRSYKFGADFLRAARRICDDQGNLREAGKDMWQLLVGYEFDGAYGQLVDLIERIPDRSQWASEERLELVLRTVLLHPVFLLNY
ncbi:MAG: hypothetical protein RIR26_1800 [Pseudomonadota bacterium]|jgi:hypothetical protein